MLLKHRLSYLISLLIFSLLLSVSFFSPHARSEQIGPPKKGQMVVITKTPENGMWPIEIKVSLFVEAPQKALWSILTDYDKLDEFVPHLKKSSVTTREKSRVYLEQEFGHLLLTMNLNLRVDEEPPHRVVFKRYAGNMKTYTGQWKLEKVGPGETIFTLEVKAEPQFYVPQKVMTWVLKSELPKGLLAMRKKALKNTGQPEPRYSIEVVSRQDF